MQFTIKPVEDQILREMCHKSKCHILNGQIASFGRCSKIFGVNEVVENALNVHLGKFGNQIRFPEGHCKPLDRILVYEMEKYFSWVNRRSYEKSIRYFVGNALINVHLTKDTQCCFKKGPECYANLPYGVSESATLVYNVEPDLWSDWRGLKEKRYMLRFQPRCSIEDVFMNVHNPMITKLLMCNNIVQSGMNGQSIFYSTGYQVKSHQKEERLAFQKVSAVLCKVIQKQVSREQYIIEHKI
jgi:hypothetical protein